MFQTTSLTSLMLFAICVTANPIVVRNSLVTLPFDKQLKFTGSKGLVNRDRARAKQLFSSSDGKQTDYLGADSDATVGLDATNAASSYRTTVGIGSPATSYTLIVDTGSSNTWVGAGKPYVRTNTSVETPDNVYVAYGSAAFTGKEIIDTMTIAPGVVIPSQSIGVASFSHGIKDADGILGLGPTNLTIGSLSPSTGSSIPTVTDNLFSEGTTSSNMVSVSFEPTNTSSVMSGELTFGGIDSSKFIGNITFTPLIRTFPASRYWGINQSIRYGSSTPILETTAGIVDTGTTLILMASDPYNRYSNATGAVLDSDTGLLRIMPEQYANLQSLFFVVGGTTFELTANAQIWPRALNSFINGTADGIYLVVQDTGRPSGQGLDFVNGFTFLERFYSVFDTENRRVGLATTPFTTATSN